MRSLWNTAAFNLDTDVFRKEKQKDVTKRKDGTEDDSYCFLSVFFFFSLNKLNKKLS